ncbi:Putative uncharacterized protein [Escherichia coli D6-117.29]|nr:hypothetical protein EL77_2211 [Escherichia coli]CDP68759.1 Protein of unknown function [Escherichia coli D6-113.11]CDP77573.1 Putative uncharacterized protein [Escherichia coli D6-117.29]KGM69161.1 hypothetical protein EL75_2411 [Escherichia coli]KGM78737.1 hypothetical protein EL80_2419 [Escherichia coli]
MVGQAWVAGEGSDRALEQDRQESVQGQEFANK